jgi:hypothetical protein
MQHSSSSRARATVVVALVALLLVIAAGVHYYYQYYNDGTYHKLVGTTAGVGATRRAAVRLPPRAPCDMFTTQSPRLCRPAYAVVGAPKCGTTALAAMILRHPLVNVTLPMTEVAVFGYAFDAKRNVDDFFASSFPPIVQKAPLGEPQRISGIKAPNNFWYPRAIRRMQKHLPQAKLFVLLRDPVERSKSWYVQGFVLVREQHSEWTDYVFPSYAEVWRQQKPLLERCYGSLLPTLEGRSSSRSLLLEPQLVAAWECLMNGLSPTRIPRELFWYSYQFVAGIYVLGLQNIFDWYPRDQVLVTFQSELKKQPQRVMDAAFDLLNLPAFTQESWAAPTPLNSRSWHAQNANHSIEFDADAVADVRAFYAKWDSALEAYLQRKLPWTTR